MSGTSLLLGAGVSFDAGLPTALRLTEKIYQWLVDRHIAEPAKLYAFVVAKILTKNARQGESPFAPVNVEEVYDALKRFSLRERDPLNEFVASWDDSLAKPKFSRSDFRRRLERLVSISERSGRVTLKVDRHRLDRLLDVFESGFSSNIPTVELGVYILALADLLTPENHVFEYLRDLVEFAENQCDVVGTLNYDLLFEKNCESVGARFDYGLGDWNNKKNIRFQPEHIKFIKLHGSLSWFAHGDDIEVDPEQRSNFRRAMIFGGQSEKLEPNGPYLQLRHEFLRITQRATKLGIVGYSFQDAHMNALLRTWITTKRRAKLVILDPGPQDTMITGLGRWSDVTKSGEQKFRVEVVHIQKGAAQGIKQFVSELSDEPNLSRAAEQPMGVRREI